MTLSALPDKLGERIIFFGLPIVQAYHLLCGSVFLNVAPEDARGVEKVASYALAPVHYLLCGQTAEKVAEEDAEYTYSFKPRFSYGEHFLVKTATSFVVLPLSAGVGAAIKAASYLFPETRDRYLAMKKDQDSLCVRPNLDYYQSIGLNIQDVETAPFIPPPSYVRRPGDESHMSAEKECLKEIVSILRANKIPFWIDCGTCLGAMRYGGIIPWDWDLDLAVLQPDFENVKHALNALDKEKYMVQDWSGRDKPGSYLKVFVKGTSTLIDIYHFAIEPNKKVVRSVFSNEFSPFFPESLKIRERRYTVATPFDNIFPLKRAHFDGIEVAVPGMTKEYLQARYGHDIGPAKVYDATTGRYEKDLSHPYWNIAHAR
ncbi:MAG: LicD family protein [Chlamydiales bacterium]|nr:LicD family protein [Chlamydiales bacterium]